LTKSKDENTSKQAKSDALPKVETDHVEGAPTANNPPTMAGPNHSFLDEKSKYRLRVKQLKLEMAQKEAKIRFTSKLLWKKEFKDRVANPSNRISKVLFSALSLESQDSQLIG
jgi:hypothetical protein